MIAAHPDWQPFSCETQPERSAARVLAAGELDYDATEPFRAHVAELLGAGFTHVIVDLRGVTFLDSSGLRTILELREDAREQGAKLTVEPGPPAVQRIFELTCTSELVFGT